MLQYINTINKFDDEFIKYDAIIIFEIVLIRVKQNP